MTRASNREQWAKRVQRWKGSGLTAREFAAEMGFNLHTLRYWSARLRVEERNRGGARLIAAKPKFVEVTEALTGAEGVTGETGLELRVADVVIRVPVGFDEHTLRQVLSVVRQP